MHRTQFWWALFALLFTTVFAAPAVDKKRQTTNDGEWVGSWTSMPQLVEPGNMPPSPFSGSTTFENATLRQTLFMSLASSKIRIQVSNTFGGSVLPVTSMTVAYPTNGQAGVNSIDTSSLVKVTFDGGKDGISIAKGDVAYSDPIDFAIKPQQNIAVTMYFQNGQQGSSICGHPGSRTTSWMQNGNHVSDATVTGANTKHWYFLTIVEAWMPKSSGAGSIIVLGDSITDGRGSEDDHNNRWPDLLATRMQEQGITNLGMDNQAAGGNAVLAGGLGPTLLTRYKRDLFEQQGVKYVVIFEGVNDIGGGGMDSTSQQQIGDGLISAFKQIASEAKAKGIVTIGATITPFGGSGYSGTTREATRQRVNEWILTGGAFDHTVDFAKFSADPNSADRLASEFDSGDHLHMNVAGYQNLADMFPLSIF